MKRAILGAGAVAAVVLAAAACGDAGQSPSPAGAGPTNVARTPTTPGVQGQSGTGDARTTGQNSGTLQSTGTALVGGTGATPTAGGGLLAPPTLVPGR